LTIYIFIAVLAFTDKSLLGAAKLGVLLGSLCAAILGAFGGVFHTRLRQS
jgi:NhaA family Na+:H+ antiporter